MFQEMTEDMWACGIDYEGFGTTEGGRTVTGLRNDPDQGVENQK